MKQIIFTLLLAGVCGCAEYQSSTAAPDAAAEFEPKKIESTMRYLSDPALGGRVSGSQGNIAARNYIVQRFKHAGLAPIMCHTDYLHNFDITVSQKHSKLKTLSAKKSGLADSKQVKGVNIIGGLDATSPTRKTIFIGAHYDTAFELKASKKSDSGSKICPGADDNASGIAAMLAIAEAMSKTPNRNFNYVFCAFDGEEFRFKGSKALVHALGLTPEDVPLMVNLDQIGHYKKNLVVFGSSMDSPFRDFLRYANRTGPQLKYIIVPVKNAKSWSDNSSFVSTGINTLFFFTGLGKFYHSQRDTIDTCNIEGVAKIAELAYRTLLYADYNLNNFSAANMKK